MWLEAAQLAQALVRAHRGEIAVFREPHGMSSLRLRRAHTLVRGRGQALIL